MYAIAEFLFSFRSTNTFQAGEYTKKKYKKKKHVSTHMKLVLLLFIHTKFCLRNFFYFFSAWNFAARRKIAFPSPLAVVIAKWFSFLVLLSLCPPICSLKLRFHGESNANRWTTTIWTTLQTFNDKHARLLVLVFFLCPSRLTATFREVPGM